MQYLGDVEDVRWVILYVAGGAFVIGFLYMIFIRCFAGCMIWTTILLFYLLLFLLCFVLFKKQQGYM